MSQETQLTLLPTQEWKEVKAMIIDLRSEVRKLTEKSGNELLTIPQAREFLNISISTLERYITEGLIDTVRPSGKPKGRRCVRRSELERKISEGAI